MLRVLIGLGVAIFGFILIAGLGQGYATVFQGKEKFDTLDEAYAFQKEIISYAESQDFNVRSEVIVNSPPRVTYSINTKDKSFWPSIDSEYGSRNFDHSMLVLVYIMATVYAFTTFTVIQLIGRLPNDSQTTKQD